MLRLDPQRLVQGPRRYRLHLARVIGRAGRVDGMADLSRRAAVARGDEPADLVVRGGKVLSVFTREWLDGDPAIGDGAVARLGGHGGHGGAGAAGRRPRAG